MSELQKHILTLSVAERLQLASFIIASISEKQVDSSLPIPEGWIQEALARNNDYESGKAKGLSWEEAKSRIHGKN